MNTINANNELVKIKKMIPELEKYQGQRVSVLPQDTRDALKQIKMLPPMTSAGLESIKSVLDNLYIAKYVIENPEPPKPKQLPPKEQITPDEKKPEPALPKPQESQKNVVQTKPTINQTPTSVTSAPQPASKIQSDWLNNNNTESVSNTNQTQKNVILQNNKGGPQPKSKFSS